CGGGAPVNKLAENGSFCSTRTSFCRLTQMVPIDLILDAFDRLKSTIDSETAYELLSMRGGAEAAQRKDVFESMAGGSRFDEFVENSQ
ncbi:MAG TPA: hypothetical protein VGD54_00260, partial [Steroidobacteraceae bacterium]